MLGAPFTHDVIRKYVVAFGTLFNNIKLQRPGSSDTQWVSVPLSYAAKEKWYSRLTDPRIAQQIATSLPRLSYELSNLTYASDRKLNTLNRHVRVNEQNVLRTMYAPVPYDLQFDLSLYCRNAADATNIVEQILPFFTPEFTVTINDATDLKIDIDCPIILNGISKEDAYEGDFESRRTIIYTLDFTMKALLFGPVQGSSGIIKKAYVDFFVPGPDSKLRYTTGNLTSDSTTSKVYLQANTASRTSNIYDNGTITILSEGPTGTTSIAGNTKTLIHYDGSSQSATIVGNFLDDPQADWKYEIQYYVDDRSSEVTLDQLRGIPTAARVYTQPGLTIDFDPTSNLELSVAVADIDANDDFGIIQTQTFFPSNTSLAGSRRNLSTGVDEL